MSGDDNSTFPHYSNSGLPPSPTIENPGQVYPPTDPSKASPTPPLLRHPNSSGQFIGNPFLMSEAFGKLDHALGNIITILEQEETSGSNNRLLRRFLDWRDELEAIRTGKKIRTPMHLSPERESEGGLFAD
ncbi:uncharacterized protein BT62DRAFT_933333 [Guyanagaster necrorhizus]|uniref:Uncharacterized protein n=1 Tax=Guyanagaster necrorhizus TaxID=856835 RepID=A0A9P7VPC4_9AGAR|nr:uncharacterized protein BT62DRAFT_933333 [Guyanagaster necrorhizus MCA 3950]KAG7444928.1 hypothetical protein BT62DRAFT_933333 [Guyanagaster necrorhizus MCA 3950]